MNIRIITLVTTICILASSSLLAQRGRHHGKINKETHQKVRAEIKAYTQEHVIPVVNAQRAKLDSYLSQAEQAQVEEIRSEMAAMKEKASAQRKLRKESFGKGERPGEDERAQMYEMRKEMRLLKTKAWEIADAHEAEIQQLLAELKPNSEVWRQEMKKIFEANKPEGAPSKRAMDENGERAKHPRAEGRRHRGQKRGHGRRMGGPQMDRFQSPVGFLLWDSEKALSFELEEPELSLYPNPTSSNSTLKFTLLQAGQVQINLLNDQGERIKTLIDESRSSGTYAEKFDLSDLEEGLYIYQIKTTEGISTKKLIIEK